MAGVPFEMLERLATPASFAGARRVLAAEHELCEAAEAALAALRKPDPSRATKHVERARRALGQRHAMPAAAIGLAPELAHYAERFVAIESMRAELASTLDDELANAGRALADAARGPLRAYSVFSASASVNDRLDAAGGDRSDRGWRARAADRLHLNYLQRVAAKNDTISEFGPTGWGRLDPDARGITVAPVPGIARRDVFLEKWVTSELTAAMTEDPVARLEAAPRLDPLGRVAADQFVRDDRGEPRPLAGDELALLAKLDGCTPAYALGALGALAVLERLVADGVVVWRFEAPALDSHRMRVLLADVLAWRPGSARTTWEPIVSQLADAPARFARSDVAGRRAIVDATEAQLAELGRAGKQRGRSLYAAANVIGEECVRDCRFTLGGDVAAQFITDAAPWLDLFGDTAAHAWRHVTTRLTELYASAPRRGGGVSLVGFLGRDRSGAAQDAERRGCGLPRDRGSDLGRADRRLHRPETRRGGQRARAHRALPASSRSLQVSGAIPLCRRDHEDRARQGEPSQPSAAVLHMAGIRSIGWWVPSVRRSAASLAAEFGVSLASLEAFGMHSRTEAAADDHPSTMGARAVTSALAAAGLGIDDVDLLIFAGITRDYPSPWVGAFGVLHQLGATRTAGFDLVNRCASVHDALWVAAKLIETKARHRVVVCCAERFDHLFTASQPTKTPADLAYSAGAAAAVVDDMAENEIAAYAGYSNPNLSVHTQNAPLMGGTRRHVSEDIVSSGLHRRRSTINLDEAKALLDYLRESDARNIPAVARAGGFDEIDFVIAAPLDVRAQLSSLAEIGIPRDKTFFLLSRLGHIGTADSLINLGVAYSNKNIGTRVVMSTRTVTFSNALAVRGMGTTLGIRVEGSGIAQAEIDHCL